MIQEVARKEVREGCHAYFKAHGFRYSSSLGGYSSTSERVRQTLHMRFVNQGGVTMLELSAAIRFEQIEVRFHKTSGIATKDQSKTETLWASAAALPGSKIGHDGVRLLGVEDLGSAVDGVLSFHESAAAHFFSENRDVLAVDRLLNAEPSLPSPYCAAPNRAFYGLIAGTLLGRSDLHALVLLHQKALGTIDRGFHLPRFEKLVTSLRETFPDAHWDQ